MSKKSNPTSPRNQIPSISSIPSLPEHFAEQVLDCETDLDLECSLQTIVKLMELYSSAIEHYESISNPKYLHYQDRLQNLLARKDVITLLNMGSPTSVSRHKSTEIIKKMQEQIALRQKYRSHQVGMFMSHCLAENKIAESRVAETVMKKYRSDNNLLRDRVIENIRNQESPDLESRVEARRRRSGTPGLKFGRTSSLNSSKQIFESYQEEVEKIIERCAEEKEYKVKGIKKRYKEEIKSVKEMGNDSILGQVVQEIKKRMRMEIEDLEREVKIKRKEMIHQIKENYA